MSDSRFNLRKPKAPKMIQHPGTAKMDDVLFNAPSMPFQPGQVVMTEGEKRDLRSVGWKPGNAIPADMARKIQVAKESFLDEETTEGATAKAAKSGHVLKVPAAVNINDLPSEKRAELQRSVEQAQLQAEQIKNAEQQMARASNVPPSVREAMMQAGSFFDSRVDDASSPLLPPQATESEPQVSAKPEESYRKADKPEEKSEEEVAITRDDFLAFYTAEFLNTDKVRFMKSYSLMGGRIELIYRAPRMKAVESVWTQVKVDQLNGKIVTVDDFWRVVYEYQMVLGLQQVKVGGQTIDVAEQVDSVLADPQDTIEEVGATPLPYLLRTLQEQAPFSSESCWRLVYANWRKFDKLVKAMEVKMDDESFCQAIGI